MATFEEKILESRPVCPKYNFKIGYVLYDRPEGSDDRWLCPNCREALFTNLDEAVRFFREYNAIKARLRYEGLMKYI